MIFLKASLPFPIKHSQFKLCTVSLYAFFNHVFNFSNLVGYLYLFLSLFLFCLQCQYNNYFFQYQQGTTVISMKGNFLYILRNVKSTFSRNYYYLRLAVWPSQNTHLSLHFAIVLCTCLLLYQSAGVKPLNCAYAGSMCYIPQPGKKFYQPSKRSGR